MMFSTTIDKLIIIGSLICVFMQKISSLPKLRNFRMSIFKSNLLFLISLNFKKMFDSYLKNKATF
jgi:hypothetical protein